MLSARTAWLVCWVPHFALASALANLATIDYIARDTPAYSRQFRALVANSQLNARLIELRSLDRNVWLVLEAILHAIYCHLICRFHDQLHICQRLFAVSSHGRAG